MRLVISQFMSLDGVVQVPGGPEEDTDGGLFRGGWSMPYFDPEVMGGFIDEAVQEMQALLFGRRTADDGRRLARPRRRQRPVRHDDEQHRQVRGVEHPHAGRPALEQLHAARGQRRRSRGEGAEGPARGERAGPRWLLERLA